MRAPTDLADDEHVRVVPVARPGVLFLARLTKSDAAHAAPVVGDVVGRAPRLPADAAAPFPDVAHTVLTQGVSDVALLLAQEFAHAFVGAGEQRQFLRS